MTNKLCHACKGLKKMIGLGMMTVKCIYCDGRGFIHDECEISNDGKQDEIESTKNTKRKATVDKSKTDNSKRKREVKRQDTSVGISSNDIQEREASGEGSQEVRCDESEKK